MAHTDTIAQLMTKADGELQKMKTTATGVLISRDPHYENELPMGMTLAQAKVSNGDMLYLKLSSDPSAHNQKAPIKGVGALPASVCARHGPNASCIQCMIANRTQISRQTETALKTPLKIDNTAGAFFRNYVYNDLVFEISRLGILYGTYDPANTHVHVIYEPPQTGHGSGVKLVEGWKEELRAADLICRGLGFSRLGMIVSHGDVDYNISTEELLLVAELCPFENSFLFLVLAIEETGETAVEAFEITKQFLELSRTNTLMVSDKPSVTQTSKEVYVDRQYTHMVDNDYFILPVGIEGFESFLTIDSPIENRRTKMTRNELKAFFQKHKPLSLLMVLSNFHLLLSLTACMDVETISEIAAIVRVQENIPEGYEVLLHSAVGMYE